jgi:hypothetical protein
MKQGGFIILLFLVLFCTKSAYAIENPLSFPNNKVGVHILFPSEIQDAARLINSNGGDWGYVTIPIQSGDKDIAKWQTFFDNARQLHVIPLIRLATEGDYFNTKVWRKPTLVDVLDFANFLDSLSWPTKNRYIIIYNETNRDDEWGGIADPKEYATILSYAVTVFKVKNPDYFIISAGLDNAAADSSSSYNEYTFLKEVNNAMPGIFNQIDGFGSHSYPNPGFSQPPLLKTRESISSFLYESAYINSITSKTLPIFITETGWSKDAIADTRIANYFPIAFANVWNDVNVAAVTPFLLEAGSGPFVSFSLLTPSGQETAISKAIEQMPKTKGQPTENSLVLSAVSTKDNFPMKAFPEKKEQHPFNNFFLTTFSYIAKYFLHL